jgi:hypothetical protein
MQWPIKSTATRPRRRSATTDVITKTKKRRSLFLLSKSVLREFPRSTRGHQSEAENRGRSGLEVLDVAVYVGMLQAEGV